MKRTFDPAKAGITLRWQVVLGGCQGETLEIIQVQTTPASDPERWLISEFFEENGIELCLGDYALEYKLGDGLRVLSMPVEIGEEGRQKFLDGFEPELYNETISLSQLLQSFPSNEEIEEGAATIIHTALRLLFKPKELDDEEATVIIPDLSQLKPGFIRVFAVACVECGNEHHARITQDLTMKGIVHHVLQVTRAYYTEIRFGSGCAFVEADSDAEVSAKVGFADHTSDFAHVLNGMLATAVQEKIDEIETVEVTKWLRNILQAASDHTRAVSQVAHSFNITL